MRQPRLEALRADSLAAGCRDVTAIERNEFGERQLALVSPEGGVSVIVEESWPLSGIQYLAHHCRSPYNALEARCRQSAGGGLWCSLDSCPSVFCGPASSPCWLELVRQ